MTTQFQSTPPSGERSDLAFYSASTDNRAVSIHAPSGERSDRWGETTDRW